MSAASERLENEGPVGRIGAVAERGSSHRRRMPETRQSVTHKFSVAGQEGYLTVGLDADGIPGELFLKMSKEGSTMSGWAQAFCRAFSLLLQHGMPLDQAVVRFKGMRFEPMGQTTNEKIPQASSVIDYIARYLEQEFESEPSQGVR
jgi:hypothetical protein